MATDVGLPDRGLVGADEDSTISFYVDVVTGELADLEVVSSAAISWSHAVRAAAQAIYPDEEIRITLIAAERGSSKWLARVERSKINSSLERMKKGWKALPLVVRCGIGLVVVVPTTAKPTYDFWTGDDGFSEKQKAELKEIVDKGAAAPAVEAPRRQMYRTLQRDPKITGVGSGVPDSPVWKPSMLVPANQFPEGEGLFAPQEEAPQERTLTPTLDVVLVAPQLENAPRAWSFRQEGIPGVIRATMKDKRFLAALDRQAVREQFRTNIPMRIRLEITEQLIDGEWKVKRKGRSVVEVISPITDHP